jgi:hypothetical protein
MHGYESLVVVKKRIRKLQQYTAVKMHILQEMLSKRFTWRAYSMNSWF